ncbi:MAG TPA: hypothetical protein VEZ12_20595, partial [Herpetosiphonaceae bacterium]|nr:hypothetical protein [Herpetosiphonaceae bacterium]
MNEFQRTLVRRSESIDYGCIGTAGILSLVWILLLFVFGSPDMGRWLSQSLGSLLLLGAVIVALYLIPGLALLRLCWRGRTITFSERLALAWGIGIALPPLLLELAHLVRLPWTRGATFGYVGLMILLLVWRRDSSRLVPRNERSGSAGSRLAAGEDSRRGWPTYVDGLLLAGLILVALLVRMFMVRDLPVGMWGDSYHHTMIAQLLVDQRGLFASWEPYAPLVTFTYHFGFHANVVFWHWLSGIPVSASLIVVGQV